jgi:FG-GAP-like repeat
MRRTVWIAFAIPPLMIASASAAALTVRDITDSTGLTAMQETWTVNTVDYDNDGLMDAWIGYHDHGAKLWRNDGDGTMSWVARSAWPEFGYRPNGTRARIDRHDSAWGDIDGDGLIDAYSTVGRTGNNNVKDATHDNELWLQTTVGTFTDIGTEVGVGDPYGRGRSAVMFDANGDGRLDLYVLNEMPRAGDPTRTTFGQDRLFLNVPDSQARYGFRLVSSPGWGLDRYLGFGRTAIAFDQNGDHRADLLVTGRARTFLFRNTGSSFVDVAAQVGLATGHIQDAELADIDADGRADLVEIRVDALSWQRNLGGTFAPAHPITPVSHGWEVAVADADGDGLVDVYAQRSSSTLNPPDLLCLNRGGSWSVVTMPTMAGHGSDVEGLRLWPGRPPVFVVLNGGYGAIGPVKVLQLIMT